jgi:multiple sugar transport system substrate-binding protein
MPTVLWVVIRRSNDMSNTIDRRKLLAHTARAGISFPALASFLAAGGAVTTATRAAAQDSTTIAIAINQSPWFPSFEETVRFYQEETGNRVELRVFTFEGLLEKTLNASNTQSPEFDIYNLNEGWCATFYAGGLVTPFSEIDPDFALDPEVIEYQFVTRWDVESNYFAEDAPVYGVPINGNIQLLFYRADLYEELGMEPPVTWDDAIAAAKAIAKQQSDVYGYAFRGQRAGYAVTYDFLPLLRGFGGDIFANPPEDWTVTLDNEAGQNAIDLFAELLSYGPSDPQNIGQAEVIALMQNGQLLQTHLANAAWASMDDEAASSVVGKVNYSLVPRPADGDHATTSGIWTMGIPVQIDDAQKQAAYDFLSWLMTKNAQMHYAQADGVVTREDVYSSELAEDEKYRYMKAYSESVPYIHRGADFDFSPRLLEITEQRLQDIAGSLLEPQAGLTQMADEIRALMKELGHS